MPRYIIRLTEGSKEWYLIWSTIVDAPITTGMTWKELWEQVREESGLRGVETLEAQRDLIRERGINSHYYDSVEEMMSGNRAGKGETYLTKAEIIQHYCRDYEPTDAEVQAIWKEADEIQKALSEKEQT